MTPEDASVRAEDLLRHRAWVRGLARSIVGSEDSVDDLEQETWLAALRRGGGGGAPGTTWLGRVVRSRAIDLLRRRTRRAARERAAARDEAVPAADDAVARADAHRAVVEAVLALEEPFRTAVLLRFFEGLPPGEVARRTGVGLEAARTRIRRGVARLRARLAPEGRPDARGALLLLLGPRAAPKSPAAASAALGGTLAMTLGTKSMIGAALCVALVGGLAAIARTTPAASDSQVAAAPGSPAAAAPAERVRAAQAVLAESEASAAADPAAGDGRLRLRLRREDGGSLAGGTALLHHGSRLVGVWPLTGEGVLELEESPEERHLVVVLAGRAPQALAVAAGAGEREVLVPRGAAVSGRVLLEGRAPDEEVPLELWLDRPVLPQPVLDLAAILRPELRSLRSVAFRTELDGTFRIEGLAADASGSVSPPWGWVPADRDAGRFAAPRTALVIDCTRSRRVRGRVVRRVTGAAVPGAHVVLSHTFEGSSGSARVVADADGRFTVYLTQPRPPERFTLEVLDAGVPVHRTVVEGPFARDRELGEVVVAEPWAAEASLRILDAEGAPVPGALAVFASGTGWASAPAGADGVVRVPLGGVEARVVVAARGHGVAEAAISPGESSLSLPRAVHVRVRVVGTCRAPSGCVLRVSGASAFDDPPDAVLDALRAALDGTEPAASVRNDLDVTWYSLPEQEMVSVPWVRPNALVRIEAFDAYGEPLDREDVVAPAGGALEVTLGTPPSRDLGGRVVDEAGRPIPGASVRASSPRRDDALAWSGGWRSYAVADEGGHFALRGVAAPTLQLVVAAPGHAPWARVVATGSESPRVVLARGARLLVRVRDARGAPAAVEYLQALPVPGDALAGLVEGYEASEADEPGAWIVEGLPPGEVELVAGDGPDAPRFRVRTDAGTVEVRLP